MKAASSYGSPTIKVSGIDTQERGKFANVMRSGAIHQIVGQ
jgi:hypothetical protein